jgi:AdoMet-dependent heme synthase
MKQNLHELPQILSLIRRLGVKTWELFFLIRVGRGDALEDLTPLEYESVCRFLVHASSYRMTIRTVEAPFIRRVAKQMIEKGNGKDDTTFDELRSKLVELEGEPASASTIRARGTLDGDGIVFVAYDGSIYPGGLTPCGLGNMKTSSLPDVYRSSPVLGRIRKREFDGYCGICQYKEICGGSRARAYSQYGDPLASDPACVYSEPNF